MNVSFHHHDLQDGDLLPLGHLQFKVLATPGHSRDSICFLLQDAKKKEHALFSGDTLFIGDVGRPDLRGGSMPTCSSQSTLTVPRAIRRWERAYMSCPRGATERPPSGAPR